MKARAVLLLLFLAACGKDVPAPLVPAPTGAVTFRALVEQQNAASCVQAPEFDVAIDEDAWITIFDMETMCQPDEEIDLPAVDFETEIALVAWWKSAPCLGFSVRTTSVERTSDAVVVRATSSGPPGEGICAQAIGTLESFLVLDRSELVTGQEVFRFVLDGQLVGTARAPA